MFFCAMIYLERCVDMEERKDNTGMIIAVVVGILLIAGIIAYFAFANNDETDNDINEPNVTDNTDTNDENKKVSGSYQAKYTTDTTGTTDTDGITNTTDNDLDATNDEDAHYIELVLDEDGTAKLVRSHKSEDVITGTYTVTDKKITMIATSNTTDTTDNNTTDDTDTTDTTGTNDKTYEFTIDSDDTLTYIEDNQTVTLTKVDKDNLKYIK